MKWIVEFTKVAVFDKQSDALDFLSRKKELKTPLKNGELMHIKESFREVESVSCITENCCEAVVIGIKEKNSVSV